MWGLGSVWRSSALRPVRAVKGYDWVENVLVSAILRVEGGGRTAYPEIYIEITRSPEFSITYLVCDRHLVVFVENFVKAFP